MLYTQERLRHAYTQRRDAGTGERRYNRLVELFPNDCWVLANEKGRALIGRVTGHDLDAWRRPVVMIEGRWFLHTEVRRLAVEQARTLRSQLGADAGHGLALDHLEVI